jgi:hypothetical protein
MLKRFALALIVAALLASPAVAQISVPNTLTSGQTIKAGDLNTNFSALANSSLNRLSGGTITGNITMSPGVTIDGIDLSVAVCSTCAANFASIATSGAILAGTTLTVGTNLTLTSPSTGITVNGINIVNSTGKIPALTASFFTSLDASTLISLNASNLSSGTVGTARLGSGSATAASYLRGDQTWTAVCMPNVVNKVALYTAVLCDFVEANGTFTVTLPAASTATNNAANVIDVKNVGAGVITVARAGADTIDGATSYTLSTQYQSVTLVANAAGNGWNIR